MYTPQTKKTTPHTNNYTYNTYIIQATHHSDHTHLVTHKTTTHSKNHTHITNIHTTHHIYHSRPHTTHRQHTNTRTSFKYTTRTTQIHQRINFTHILLHINHHITHKHTHTSTTITYNHIWVICTSTHTICVLTHHTYKHTKFTHPISKHNIYTHHTHTTFTHYAIRTHKHHTHKIPLSKKYCVLIILDFSSCPTFKKYCKTEKESYFHFLLIGLSKCVLMGFSYGRLNISVCSSFREICKCVLENRYTYPKSIKFNT